MDLTYGTVEPTGTITGTQTLNNNGIGTIQAGSKPLKYYSQNQVTDPYAQISNSGFTPLGNLKQYGVANLYDRPEPTHLKDLKDTYTVPYLTSPFLGTNTTSIKYIDDHSEKLRTPVFNNRKSAITVSDVTFFPEQSFVTNPGMSPELNNYYQQFTTISSLGKDDQYFPVALDSTKPMLGQMNDGLNSNRYVNRWNYVDPRITQNVDHIIMNVKNSDGNIISLPQCGISTRNELRNYVEVNNC